MRQKSRYIIGVLSFCILFGLVHVPVAHAGFWDAFTSWTNFTTAIGNTVLIIFGSLVHVGGILLDASIEWTVINMHEFVSGIDTINLTWRIFRDVANITFIFILLYAAIATILQISNFQTKQVVIRLVIVALLVNFSLFFTKAVVDVSNVVAIQFYNAMEIDNPQRPDDDRGIADALMNNLRLTSVYSHENGVMNPNNMLSITIIGSIFFLIAAFVFLAGAILFIIRFAVLILLMVVAPFAFVAMILPSTKQYWDMWKNALLKQAMFAPIYLSLTYLVVRIVNDPEFKSALYSGGSSLADEIGGTAAFAAGGATVTLGFGLVAALLIAILIISQKMSLAGAGTINKWGNQAQRWGRTKVQRGAGRVAGTSVGFLGRKADEGLGNTMIGNTRIGNAFRNITTQKAMNAKLGAGSKYIDRRKKSVKAKEERAGARTGVAERRIGKREDKVATQYQGRIEDIRTQAAPDIIDLQKERAKLIDKGTPETDVVVQGLDKRIKRAQEARDEQIKSVKTERDTKMNEAAEQYLEKYEKSLTYPLTEKRVFKGNKMTADKIRSFVYEEGHPDPDSKPWENEDKEAILKDWRTRRALRRQKKKDGAKQGETDEKIVDILRKILEEQKS